MNDLLSYSDPAPVRISGDVCSPGPILLVGDHAGSAIPVSLGDLGLDPAERRRHIALDIGSEALGLRLGELLGAVFIRQVYSRLVIDCNRAPEHADAMREVSDGTPIPGNLRLDAAGRRDRIEAVFTPYQQAIGQALDQRAAAGLTTILVSLHSFTPVMNGFARPWHIGVLHAGGETGYALALLDALSRQSAFMVAANEPYVMDDTDYTVPHHAFARGLPYAELEIRQDLLERGDEGVEEIARLLAAAMKACVPGASDAYNVAVASG